jgi:hypothetical protein
MRLLLFALSIMTAIFIISCQKDKNLELPPETQTGTGTFGCLVDGKVYKPGGRGASLSGGIINCNYQVVNGQIFFRLAANNHRDPKNRRSIALFMENIEIEEGKRYALAQSKSKFEPQAVGQYLTLDPTIMAFLTDSIYMGELWIKKFDLEKNIVSGTFWFDAVNEQGQKVQVREGRFDVLFGR